MGSMARLSFNEIASYQRTDYSAIEVSISREVLLGENFQPCMAAYIPKKGEVGTIYAQYAASIGKHSSYRYRGLPYGILTEDFKVLKVGHSYIASPYYVDKPWLFIASHFAPYSVRDGAELLAECRDSGTVMVLAVLPFMGKQLVRLGYTKVTETEQYFAGELVLKEVYTNHPEVLARLAKKAGTTL